MRAGLGPYLLNDIACLPIARPVPARPEPETDDTDTDWQSTPEGRYVITDDGSGPQAAAAILYAFWRIQNQAITIAPKPPLDRPARRRALLASIRHDTRVLMLATVTAACDTEAQFAPSANPTTTCCRSQLIRIGLKPTVEIATLTDGCSQLTDAAARCHVHRAACVTRCAS